MAISKKQREKILSEKAADFKESTDNLLEELNAGIAEKTETTAAKQRKKSNFPFYPPSDKLHTELKVLAALEKTSVNKLLIEGISLLLEKRGKNINDYVE